MSYFDADSSEISSFHKIPILPMLQWQKIVNRPATEPQTIAKELLFLNLIYHVSFVTNQISKWVFIIKILLIHHTISCSNEKYAICLKVFFCWRL